MLIGLASIGGVLTVSACRLPAPTDSYHLRAGSPGDSSLRWSGEVDLEETADGTGDVRVFGANPFHTRNLGVVDEPSRLQTCEVDVEIRDPRVFQGRADATDAKAAHSEAKAKACTSLKLARTIDCDDSTRARVVLTDERTLEPESPENGGRVEVVYTAIPLLHSTAIAESDASLEDACERAVEAACWDSVAAPCPPMTLVLGRRTPLHATDR
jgi:hypothetical protein